ncbi:MAG: dihydropteroate synthase [Chloroflexota bacterium]
MGILNLTPDSFSGDGLHPDVEAATRQAREMVSAGADVLDLGGESTAYWKPGYQPVSENEELHRVLPVLERLRAELAVPLSIDTRKPAVARRAIAAGATWLNDVEGVWDDGAMAQLSADHHLPFVLMHNSRTSQYQDVVVEVRDDLARAADRALALGVEPDTLILDPGLGFGKQGHHNLELLRRLEELRALGFPLLIGPSRKRFLGEILNAREHDRLEGTEAAVSVAISRGADAVRVHDVAQVARVVRVTDAIVRGRPAA